MNRITIYYKGKLSRYRAPDGWNDLSRKQLLTWCGIIRQRITPELALDAAVVFFYKVPLELMEAMNEALRVQLRMSLEYLVKNELTRNVLGSIRVLGLRYCGPENRLGNVSIGAYRRTELVYQLYVKTGETMYLDMLAAALYTRERVQTEKQIMRRAKFFNWALDPKVRQAILLFYEGCRGYIIKQFPRVFVKPAGGNVPAIGAAPSPVLNDLEDIILTVAGEKFGPFADTENTNLFLFFKHLTLRIEEAEKSKKK